MSSKMPIRFLQYCLLLCFAVTAVTAQYGGGGGGGSGGGGGGYGGGGYGGGGYGGGGSSGGSSTNPPPSVSSTGPNGVATVLAGASGKIAYTPDTLHVAPGGKVEFHFFPPNHSLAQASFDNPCHPMSATSLFSGWLANTKTESNMIFTVTVNNTDPIWLYCPYLNDCQLGMVAVINPPSNGQTLDQFRAAAKKASKSTYPAAPEGGIISMEKGTSSGSSSGTSSSTASPASPSKTGAALALTVWPEAAVILGLSVLAALYVM